MFEYTFEDQYQRYQRAYESARGLPGEPGERVRRIILRDWRFFCEQHGELGPEAQQP